MILMTAYFTSKNVQVTVSPACKSMLSTVSPSLFELTQDVFSNFQSIGTISETEYVPGSRSPLSFCWPSLRKKLGPQLGSNSKLVVSPSGSVSLTTMMFASFSFVNVQVTVSPASSSIVPGVSVSLIELTHAELVRFQPAGTVSLTE